MTKEEWCSSVPTRRAEHSKSPTSPALAREPRRRLLAVRFRDCSPPRLAYSERTPSVPRCQYPGARSTTGLCDNGAGGLPPAPISEHDHQLCRPGRNLPAGHRMLVAQDLLADLGGLLIAEIVSSGDERGVAGNLKMLGAVVVQGVLDQVVLGQLCRHALNGAHHRGHPRLDT